MCYAAPASARVEPCQGCGWPVESGNPMAGEQGVLAKRQAGVDEPGWGWRDVLAVLVLMIVGGATLLLTARAVVAGFGLDVERRLVSPVFYLVGLGIYLVAIAGVHHFAARRAGWAALGLRPAGWLAFALVPPLFIVGLIGLALVNSVVGLLAGGFENPQVGALTGGRALSPSELIALLLLVAGVVPFAEELFFRGMLYPLIRARTGAVAAVVLNAALFSLAHVIPQLLPGLFVVGLCLAYLRERSGSIWPSVCYHAIQNALALLLINATLGAGAL